MDSTDTSDQRPPVADWIETAALNENVRQGSRFDSVRLGDETVRTTLLGADVSREADLGSLRLSRGQIEELEKLGESDAVDRVRSWIRETRAARRSEAQAELAEDAESVQPLIEALPAEEHRRTIKEAVAVMREPGRSIRKFRKRLRRWLIALRIEERRETVQERLPELTIRETRGSVAFETMTTVPVRVWDWAVEVPVVASVNGGDLEELFLTGSIEAFVAAAQKKLDGRLLAESAEWRKTAAEVESFLKERDSDRFYDRDRLRTLVLRELQDIAGREPDEVMRTIRSRTKTLDFMAKERETVWRLVHDENLVAYKDMFAMARAMDRKLVLYVGPTNSGKTWHALNTLAESESGVYLAPLRLLALEGQEEIEKRGKTCNFMTGEERDMREGAQFTASTIEMMDPMREVEAAVIDEVQMLSDEDRGWAWSQALVGVAAKRVLMTGSPDCVELVQAIADYLGEPLEIHPLERFTELKPLEHHVKIDEVEPGTAVIAFSRRDVLRYKAELGETHKVSVIYGNLTPEVRREEARRFREGESDVVVATDAIAMGLNLPIKTVLFSTLRKWNGEEEIDLPTSLMLQIGGRAGRFGKYEEGFVGALRARDVERVERVFQPGNPRPQLPLVTAVRPLGPHIDVIADGIGTGSLKKALVTFQRGMTFDSPMFVPGVTDEMIELAEMVDRYEHIPLEERLTLSCAPVDSRSQVSILNYQDWIAAFAAGRQSHLPDLPDEVETKPYADTDQELHEAEKMAKSLTVYAWLAYRYPKFYPDLERCQEQRAQLDDFIERSLARQILNKICAACKRPLPGHWRHKTCAACFRGGSRAEEEWGGPRGGRGGRGGGPRRGGGGGRGGPKRGGPGRKRRGRKPA